MIRTREIIKNFIKENTIGIDIVDELEQWLHVLNNGKSFEVKHLRRKLEEENLSIEDFCESIVRGMKILDQLVNITALTDGLSLFELDDYVLDKDVNKALGTFMSFFNLKRDIINLKQ